MPLAGLTPEQRRLVEQAGDGPVRIDDPETHEAYVLVREEVYQRLGGMVRAERSDQSTVESGADQPVVVPDGIRRSKDAFLHALPGLLARKRLHGRWVVYAGDEQVGIARRGDVLIREVVRRGLRQDQYYLACIRPHDDEPEEIEHSLFEFDQMQP